MEHASLNAPCESVGHLATLRQVREAGHVIAASDAPIRRAWLAQVAVGLMVREAAILAANADDLAAARARGLDAAKLDRMGLDHARVAAMAAAVSEIATQVDPLAEVLDLGERPSGIHVWRMRAPLGLIAMIYEARPNVTIDAAALAIFAGNAIVLRPGREIRATSQVLGEILCTALAEAGLPREAIRVLDDPDRLWFKSILNAVGVVDLLIPRGGESLIAAVQAESKVPVLAHATGVCHIYVDREADLAKAVAIALNAKIQRPGVCNAMEGLLIDAGGRERLLPPLVDALAAAGVTLHGPVAWATRDPRIVADGDRHRGHEWLSLDLTLQEVDGVEGAIAYIRRHGSQHTEAIITENSATADYFIKQVEASAVIVNASTRFNDGGELGLGAEIGISTSRLHAWGPMGAQALTTQRWVIRGEGSVRS